MVSRTEKTFWYLIGFIALSWLVFDSAMAYLKVNGMPVNSTFLSMLFFVSQYTFIGVTSFMLSNVTKNYFLGFIGIMIAAYATLSTVIFLFAYVASFSFFNFDFLISSIYVDLAKWISSISLGGLYLYVKSK